MLKSILAAALLALLPLPARAEVAERVERLPVRDGVTENFYLTEPDAPAKAAVVLLAGAAGAVDVREPIPTPGAKGNFLVRTRRMLAGHGLVVATVDAPSDMAEGMTPEFRMGATHAEDLGKVADWLKARYGLPVWLVGTSKGTLSAANAAIRLGTRVDGIGLTSTLSRAKAGKMETEGGVLALDLDRVKVPTLVLAHRDDGCWASPAADAPAIVRRLTASPRVQFIQLTGGTEPKSDPCEALARHGYIGIEEEAVAAMAGFILGH